MNVSPAQNASPIDQPAADAGAFDSAVSQAKGGLSDAEFTELLVNGAVSIAGPMLIMPKANEVLNEAMSDD